MWPLFERFRRSVTLEPRGGLRDVTGYDALLRLISIAKCTVDDDLINSLHEPVSEQKFGCQPNGGSFDSQDLTAKRNRFGSGS